MTIRSLAATDIAQVLALNAAARPHVAALDQAEVDRLRLLSSAHLVAADRDGLLGYALIFRRGDAYDGEEFQEFRVRIDQPFAYIDQIVIAEQARRLGGGRRLYQAIAASARAEGIRALCCEVNLSPANPVSLAFHHRLGYRSLGSLRTRDGRLVDLLQARIPEQAAFAGP